MIDNILHKIDGQSMRSDEINKA